MRRIRARVTGRVQGVGFRYFTASAGRALGLAGFVRNEPDGSVVVEAEGPPGAIEQLLEHLRRGPGLARVAHVAVEDIPPVGDRGPFDVERS
ncbi:MAG TPA: acylphosphatase [Planctomycetota bacterium]|nr:acylphosphatase [Planctomycetota bacterium]